MLTRFCGTPIRIRSGKRDAPALLAIADKVHFYGQRMVIGGRALPAGERPDVAIAFAKLALQQMAKVAAYTDGNGLA